MGRTGFRLFRRSSETVLRLVERVSGLEFLRSISEFLLAFESMLGGFTLRAHEVEALLRSSRCGFLLVAGPNADQVRRAERFWSRLDEEKIRLVGLVLNRVHVWPGGSETPELSPDLSARARAWLERGLHDPEGARGLFETVSRQASLARRDHAFASRLAGALPLPSEAIRTVPLMAEDVHAIEGLRTLAAEIFAEGAGAR